MSYSIIIPHYNLPDLLERCLKSIPVRSDIQVIVVDDKSDDSNRTKIREIQDIFPHVQFIFSEQNGGGGAARNRGIAAAKGDYILFADADDYFVDGFDKLLDKYAISGNDITYFNVDFVDEKGNSTTIQKNHVDNIMQIYKQDKASGEMLLRYSFGEPWCKMIRRELIIEHQILFDETCIHNDTKFSYLTGFYAKSVSVCNTPIYKYLVRPESVSRSISNEKILTRTKIFAEKNKFLIDHQIPFFDKLLLASFLYCKKTGKKDLYKECMEIALQYGIKKRLIERKIFISKSRAFTRRQIKRIKNFLTFKWGSIF